jgi:hypothetical protein
MDFDFSDDQEQLRDAVRKWVDKGYDFERRRKTVAAGGFDRAAYNELAELGLAGLYISEADGGMGMGPVEGMVVLEELGRGIVLEPLTQTLIAGGVLSATAAMRSRRNGCRRSPRAKPWWCWPIRNARHATDSTFAKPKPPSPAPDGRYCYKKHGPAGDQADAFIVPATWTARSPCSWSSARQRRHHARLRHAGWRARR